MKLAIGNDHAGVEMKKEIKEYPVDQLKFRPRKKKGGKKDGDADMKELAALEDKEKSKL